MGKGKTKKRFKEQVKAIGLSHALILFFVVSNFLNINSSWILTVFCVGKKDFGNFPKQKKSYGASEQLWNISITITTFLADGIKDILRKNLNNEAADILQNFKSI